MIENASRNVKLALSLLDDAKRAVASLQHEDPILRGIPAQEIIDGNIAKAKRLLMEAAQAGEDTSRLQARCASLVADIAEEVAEGHARRADANEIAMQHYKQWLVILVAAREEAVRLDPCQGNMLLLGIWLQSCERYDEARDALKIAETGNDEELSLQASKELMQLEERVSTRRPKNQYASTKTGGCYIATACYGSYDHPDVITFRQFRDKILLNTAVGRVFVWSYYKLSPPIASRLCHVRWLSTIIRKWLLEPLARKLR